MFGSSLPPVVCMMAHVLFTLFVFDFQFHGHDMFLNIIGHHKKEKEKKKMRNADPTKIR
jgi:hypothetical protein